MNFKEEGRDSNSRKKYTSVHLLGYSMTPCEQNPTYSAEFFKNQQQDSKPSTEIDDQLAWLEQELAITNKQTIAEINKLNVRVRDV